jgi:uncharacterized protein (TIGR03546 family)
MLALVKLTRWIYNTLAGAMTPNQIAYGLCLGIFLALMPTRPLSLSAPYLAVVALLMLLTRASIWLFMLGAVLLKPAMHLGLRPLPWKLGRHVLDGMPGIHDPLRSALNAPVIAWFPFDRYAVMGGFLLALALSIVLFMPVRWAVLWFRRVIQPRADQYRIVRWWRGFFLTKALSFVFIGTNTQ